MPIPLLRPVLAFCLMAALGACSVFGSAAAPEPAYDVVRSDGDFEVRDYNALAVVATPMADGQRAAFGRLFDYITGENKGATEIAMTAPVLQSAEAGTEIAMTAPVLQSFGADGEREMVFVLTDKFTATTAPEPNDPQVRIAEIPARRVATLRFSGSFGDDAVRENTARLQAWMTDQGLAPVGPPESAGYNPPWTLPPFRRNEVLIPVVATES